MVAVALMAGAVMVFFGVQRPDNGPEDIRIIPFEPSIINPSLRVTRSNNAFALDLYKAASLAGEEGNLFFSPYSVFSAMAMTYEGARGKTAEEIRSVFYFPENKNDLREGFLSIYNQVNEISGIYDLETANAVWAQKNFVLLDEYIRAVNFYYGGESVNLDFAAEPEESRRAINLWSERKTRERIKDLIPFGVITPATRLVLTNAAYFKSDWRFEFDRELTKQEIFFVTPRDAKMVPMMRFEGTIRELRYLEEDNIQILELPYGENEGSEGRRDLSMIILLPERNRNLESLAGSLTVEDISRWQEMIENTSPERVKVYFPRFKFEEKYFIGGTLSDMGMSTAFSGGADFSGMTGDRDLYINEVIHQTFIEIDEEGTEAAAATAVVMAPTSPGPGYQPPPIPEFRADRPFVFFIQDNRNDLILFFGRVADPTAEF